MNDLLQTTIDNIVNLIDNKFKTLRIFPNQIEIVQGVSDISKRLGLFRNGEFRLGNSAEPGFGFTGLRIGYPPFTYANDRWVFAVIVNDVLQFGITIEGEIMPTSVKFSDSPNIDPFSRLRVSSPTGLLDSQFTYDLQPVLFEAIAESSSTVVHDAVNRCATLNYNNAGAGLVNCMMQSYEWFKYQSGRGQTIFITFNMGAVTPTVYKYARYGTEDNCMGFLLQPDGTKTFQILSQTDNANETVNQVNWNLDKLDGTGTSGITLDVTKNQILVLDFQALYVGRVRIGFDIGGVIIYCHEFVHANSTTASYIQTATLPISVGMYGQGVATSTMQFYCATVISEGGTEDMHGFNFSVGGTVTASSGARTHLLSIRPKTTFNSISNRSSFRLDSVEIMATGSNPIKWELVLNQAITGTTAFSSANANYSGMEYNTAGTISGSPAIVIAEGYVPATAQSRLSVSKNISTKYPITISAAGAVRGLGTLSLIVTGLGGVSACYGSLVWKEVR